MQQDVQLPAAAIRGEHALDDGQRHARLMAEAADIALPGIEIDDSARGVGERIVAPVVVADALGELHVAGGRAALLDPGVFVRRDGLGGELPADPVGFFGHDDGLAHAQDGQRRADRACAAADDENVAASFSRHIAPSFHDEVCRCVYCNRCLRSNPNSSCGRGGPSTATPNSRHPPPSNVIGAWRRLARK